MRLSADDRRAACKLLAAAFNVFGAGAFVKNGWYVCAMFSAAGFLWCMIDYAAIIIADEISRTANDTRKTGSHL